MADANAYADIGLDPNTPRLLPLPGGDSTGIALFIDALVRENAKDHRRLVFQAEAQRAYDLYLGNHWDAPQADTDGDPISSVEGARMDWWKDPEAKAQVQYVINRIQNCVISVMAIQAGDPPKIVHVPRETGDPPVYYLNTDLPQGQALAQELFNSDAANGAQQPFNGYLPLPDELAKPLLAQVEQAKLIRQQAAAMNQPEPLNLPPDDLVLEVSYATAIEARQTVFDGLWDDAQCLFHFSENVLNKNIVGVQPTTYEWDDQCKLPVLTNVHVLQVFMDPIRSVGPRNTYTIYDEPISQDEALAMYPQFAKLINDESWFHVGNLKWPGSRSYTPGYRYTQTFYRPMGVIRHAFLRNQPYPMSPDEAMQAGHVTLQNLPITYEQVQPSQSVSGDSEPSGDEATESKPQSPADQDDAGASAGGAGGAADGEPVPANPPPTRPAFIHAASGQEVAPGKPGWPTRYGIRQIKIIGFETVQDTECQFGDIPIPVNINLPIPYSPWAQGEPKRLEGLQMAINGLLTSVINHAAYNAYAPEFIAEQLYNAITDESREAHSKPNQRYMVPQAVLETVQYDIKKLFMTVDLPSLPADFWKLLELLLKLIDQEGNQADVMQGEAAAGWSGEVVKALQTASAQVIRAKSMHTEFYLRWLAKLMVHSMCYRMTWQDWGRYVKKYPPHVLKAIQELNVQMEKDNASDVSISVASGSGASKAGKTQEYIAAQKQGIPISPQTIMEGMDLDADAELQKAADWERKKAATLPPPAPVMGQPQGQPEPQPPQPQMGSGE